MQKKLLSLLLSVSLIASLFACIPMNAFAEEITGGKDLTPEGAKNLANNFKGTATWYGKTDGENDAKFVTQVLPKDGSVQLNYDLAGISSAGADFDGDGKYNSQSSSLAGILFENDNDNTIGNGSKDYYSAQTLMNPRDIILTMPKPLKPQERKL